MLRKGFTKIAIIGLGYVGLPLAVEFAKSEINVIGIERKIDRVRAVNRGEFYINDVENKVLKNLVKNKRLIVFQQFDVLKDVDAIIICVPTPLTINKTPDISYIIRVSKKISPFLHTGEVVVLESTTYPGTTEEVVLPILSKSGFKPGKDFYLAYSPERIEPGNKTYSIRDIPKIIGGINKESTKMASELYGNVFSTIFKVSSPRVAEMAKLLENTFRLVNVALVDELAILCEKMNIGRL